MSSADTCSDCGRVKFTGYAQTGPLCVTKSDCAAVTIARMRPVVAAASTWSKTDGDVYQVIAEMDLMAALRAGGFVPALTPEESTDLGEAAAK